MIKEKENKNTLTDNEIDRLLGYLNAAYERTGDVYILKCIELLMEENNNIIITIYKVKNTQAVMH